MRRIAELSPNEKALADQSTLSLDEARAILDRAGGKPLSKLILRDARAKGMNDPFQPNEYKRGEEVQG
ncbi:MAG: hypothetical protein MI924_04390 [Chloroflexales bacterium]|nr:hypothetical protein [Chloroflexales bacterium]